MTVHDATYWEIDPLSWSILITALWSSTIYFLYIRPSRKIKHAPEEPEDAI